MATIKVSDLAAKLKDQYLQQSDFFRQEVLVDGMGFLDYFAPPIITKDEVPLTRIITGDLVQPGAKAAFNPTADAHTFKARISKVRAAKVDLQYTPVDINLIANTYYGFLAKMKKTYHDVSFAEFFMDQVKAKLKENIRMKALYSGVYDNAGTGPEDIFDGLLALMDAVNAVPAGNKTTSAAITSSNAIDVFEALYAEVDSKFHGQKLYLIAAPGTLRNYFLDYRNTHGGVIYNKEFLKMGLDGTNTEFVEEPALNVEPDRVIITTENNLTWHVNTDNNMDDVTVETALRNLNVMIDFECAPNFFNGEEIWYNVLA